MIGLDTNVVVRLLIEDGEEQTAQARRFVSENCSARSPAFVNNAVILETVWVLESFFGYARAEIAQAVSKLLDNRALVLERSEIVRQAAGRFSTGGADFADSLIGGINSAEGCETTATFDKKAARLDGFKLVR